MKMQIEQSLNNRNLYSWKVKVCKMQVNGQSYSAVISFAEVKIVLQIDFLGETFIIVNNVQRP